jgi:di/tricarboxylate transporter
MKMDPTTIAACLFCFTATALLARYDLHTDDTGVEVFLILAVTFILGCLHPLRAWQWALPAGITIPAVELVTGGRSGNLKQAWDVVLLTGFLIALGLAGSYSGAAVRRLAAPSQS